VPEFFPGVKRQDREVYHSPLSSAEVKEWSYTPIPSIYLHDVDRDNFISHLYNNNNLDIDFRQKSVI
jgi:hypothetical protein